jgi:hypothetical protein
MTRFQNNPGMSRGRRIGLAAVLPLLLLLVTGCAAVVVGAAAGAGVYTWMEGELIRSYQSDFDQTAAAAAAALTAMDIPVYETRRNSLTTTLTGEVYNGKPVTVTLQRQAGNITEVAVRSGYVGYWDRGHAERIHAAIAERLDG